MPTDSRIDTYIANAMPFAQPILARIRSLVHLHCPEATETIKWGSPSFTYKSKIMCGMAAFKDHATFGFWYGQLVTGTEIHGAMGSFGRLQSIDDLPDDDRLAEMFAIAIRLIDDGVKPPRAEGRGKHAKPELQMLPAFRQALESNPRAEASYFGFPASQQREYLEWITDAKREDTRTRRISQAVEWLAEGKRRYWKYENC